MFVGRGSNGPFVCHSKGLALGNFAKASKTESISKNQNEQFLTENLNRFHLGIKGRVLCSI
jgi:hypothetical protein